MHLINLQKEILGIVLLYPETLDDIEAILDPDMFSEPMKSIYSDMLKTRAFDLVSLSAKHPALAKDMLAWTELGGITALLPQYCRTLAEGSTVNQIKRVCQEAQKYEGSAAEIINKVESGIMKLQAKGGNEPVDMQTGLANLVAEIEAQSTHKGVSGLSTGFPDLDRPLDGLHTGELVIVAGRPSMGKTALAVNIGQYIARKHAVLMFSLEMSATQLHKRMVSTSSKIPFSRIRSGNLTPNDWSILTSSADTLNKLKFHTDETPGIALHHLVSKARRMKRQHDLKLIIVDYLQLMTLPRNESRVSALGHVTRSLKNLSKELDVNIVLLSQLSRGVDGREDKRPVMSDLRESGEIEQDADVILFPFREAAYCRDCRDRRNTTTHDYQKHQRRAEILVEKQRNGERNLSVPVCWLGEYCCFENLAK